MRSVMSFLFVMQLQIACGQVSQTTIKPPADLADGIQTGIPSSVGLNNNIIKEIEGQLTSGYFPNIHSLLICKDNKLVYEQYFRGKDETWGRDLGVIEHSINSLHDIRSISKSIVSACIGIAIAQGKIKNVDQPVFGFFKEYSAEDTGSKKNLTIHHLLTMSAGLKWNEDIPYNNPENSEIQMVMSPDPIAFVLSRPMVAAPGKEWNYNGGTTQALATILEKTTGMKADAFAKEYLFKPLGISNFEWIKFPGTDNPAAASGLRLRSRDLLKFGLLYQNKGNWKGQQLLPATWIGQSFKSWINRPRGNGSYGYQFWIWNEKIQEKSIRIVACVGNGNQRIFFDEQNKLLVVITAGNYNLWDLKEDSDALFKRIYDSFTKIQ